MYMNPSTNLYSFIYDMSKAQKPVVKSIESLKLVALIFIYNSFFIKLL